MNNHSKMVPLFATDILADFSLQIIKKYCIGQIIRCTRVHDSGIFAAFMLSALKQATADFKKKYIRGEVLN